MRPCGSNFLKPDGTPQPSVLFGAGTIPVRLKLVPKLVAMRSGILSSRSIYAR
jgi:hypothetical protein